MTLTNDPPSCEELKCLRLVRRSSSGSRDVASNLSVVGYEGGISQVIEVTAAANVVGKTWGRGGPRCKRAGSLMCFRGGKWVLVACIAISLSRRLCTHAASAIASRIYGVRLTSSSTREGGRCSPNAAHLATL